MKKTNTYYIECRKWFDKVNGNTYHSVRISKNGEIIRTIGMTYGYGSCWEQTALDALKEMGLAPTKPVKIKGFKSKMEINNLWQFKEYVGRENVYTSETKGLKRDLFKA